MTWLVGVYLISFLKLRKTYSSMFSKFQCLHFKLILEIEKVISVTKLLIIVIYRNCDDITIFQLVEVFLS